MGLALTIPLHYLFSLIWSRNQLYRFSLSLIAVVLVAALWTGLRMFTFILITGEDSVWSDFGGWVFGGIFVFLCWTGLYHGIRYFFLVQTENTLKKAAEEATTIEQLKRLSAEGDAKEAQLKMLRYQLNPHFLFNTLNAINALIHSGQTERAQRIVIQLSKFLRYSLDNNPEMKIPLDREVEALNLYLEIEKTRFEERLNLEFKIDDASKKALVPSLLMQPLIENSMKYAIAKNEQGGTIRLSSKIIGDQLRLELSDTGTGQELQPPKIRSSKGRGIGLRNTTDRLKAFYGENYNFDLTISSTGGLKTTIDIPFELVSEGTN